MIKNIHVEQLRPGMYVADLGSTRLAREVIHNYGYMADANAIETLKNYGVSVVAINTDKGLDVPAKAAKATPAKPVSFSAEMARAKNIHKQTISLIKNLLSDVKLGHAIDTGAVGQVADDIVSSVFRNPNALMCLGMIRRKDNYLMEHSVNLSVLMAIFGKHLGFEQGYIRETAIGALLHDLGKIRVPDAILHKPGGLSDAEFAVMRTHPAHSLEILQNLPDISRIALETAAQHHEKIDGTGYPHGLSGEQLSIHGRMLAIVDVYDAITADRCYHDRITAQEALRRMLQWTRHHLDGELLQQFIKAIGVYPVGSLVRLASGKMGVVLESRRDNVSKPLVRIFYNYKHRHYLPIEDVDMSRPRCTDHIIKAEDPRNFGIDIDQFMPV
ncbi:MAG: HD-GYP domain-containing protein [Methylococcaceae bacterium]|nr:MAG: HD-GYP domain-containing protein [Methylococcaceae bacterium]